MSLAIDKTPAERLSAARTAALRALALRARTTAEMRERLRRRFGDEVAQAVVDQLTTQRLLDDDAYAAAWRSGRERHRPRSAALVARELQGRGVAPDIAARAIAGMDDAALAVQAAQAYVGRLANTTNDVFTRRLAAYLGRRGFGASVIWKTVAQFRDRRAQERGGPLLSE